MIYITCFLTLVFKGLVEKDHFIILAYHHHWMKNTFLSPFALHEKKTIALSYFDEKRILCSSVYVWYPLISIVVSFILHSIFPPLLPITQEDTYFHVCDCKCHWLWKLHLLHAMSWSSLHYFGHSSTTEQRFYCRTLHAMAVYYAVAVFLPIWHVSLSMRNIFLQCKSRLTFRPLPGSLYLVSPCCYSNEIWPFVSTVCMVKSI